MHLQAEYTRGGAGTLIVKDLDAGMFFLQDGMSLLYVAGEPKPHLDGGCYAEEPQWLSGDVLDFMKEEGYICNPEQYRRSIHAAFRRGPS